MKEGVLEDDHEEIAEFINQTNYLSWTSLVVFLQERLINSY